MAISQFNFPVPSGVPVVLFSTVTPASNSGTTETTLATYTLPAKTLGVNGQAVDILASFAFAANTNAKTVAIRVGANSIGSTGSTTASQFPVLHVIAVLTPDGLVTLGREQLGAAATSGTVVTDAETASFTATNANTFTATGTGGATGDVTLRFMRITFLPAGA
jgi:hypothetical protein